MTFVNPLPYGPYNPYIYPASCPSCGRGFVYPSPSTSTFTHITYQPRHRKPGPAK